MLHGGEKNSTLTLIAIHIKEACRQGEIKPHTDTKGKSHKSGIYGSSTALTHHTHIPSYPHTHTHTQTHTHTKGTADERGSHDSSAELTHHTHIHPCPHTHTHTQTHTHTKGT